MKMKRRFNITGFCSPERHYMVRLDDRLKQIKENFVDYSSYFVINRGRQYGKTTTLRALKKYLADDYIVLSLDFQQIGTADFADEITFVSAFAEMLLMAFQFDQTDHGKLTGMLEGFIEKKGSGLKDLFVCLSDICKNSIRPIVLMIDEVDSASNNQVFIDFLAQLRAYYLNRDEMPIFHSVILAGVYDIKNLKLKLRPDSEHQYNSPWNIREGNEENERLRSLDDCPRDQIEHVRFDIAADFDIVMSFSASQIAGMLEEYEADNQIGMDIKAVAEEIYHYTSGYPVLVSLICKLLDESLPENTWLKTPADMWSGRGVTEAVKQILIERMPLFESMVRQLNEYPEMKQMIQLVLFQGKRVSYNPDLKAVSLAAMFGYIRNVAGSIQVANRIFEMRLYNLFLSEEELTNALYDKAQGNQFQFVSSGRLDMDLVIEKFVLYFQDIYGEQDEKFLEEQGRKLFLLYLKPIINGIGNYYIEAQTRDARRTDVIVDYLGEQFIIELKIWHGNEYRERGEKQLADYLDYYHKDRGYLVSFNFNRNKKTGIQAILIGTKTIVEAVV